MVRMWRPPPLQLYGQSSELTRTLLWHVGTVGLRAQTALVFSEHMSSRELFSVQHENANVRSKDWLIINRLDLLGKYIAAGA